MPRCEGLPTGPCPRSRNDRTVTWTGCDLYLCKECYNLRWPVVSSSSSVNHLHQCGDNSAKPAEVISHSKKTRKAGKKSNQTMTDQGGGVFRDMITHKISSRGESVTDEISSDMNSGTGEGVIGETCSVKNYPRGRGVTDETNSGKNLAMVEGSNDETSTDRSSAWSAGVNCESYSDENSAREGGVTGKPSGDENSAKDGRETDNMFSDKNRSGDGREIHHRSSGCNNESAKISDSFDSKVIGHSERSIGLKSCGMKFKKSGTCSVCLRLCCLLVENGTIHPHGPVSKRCPGSKQPPLIESAFSQSISDSPNSSVNCDNSDISLSTCMLRGCHI